LGETTVKPLENITFSKTDDLNYFYEPQSNSSQSVDLSWMGDEFNYSVNYRINNDGLNQLTNFSVSNPGDKFRIITIGDSFTFGANVNTGQDYPSQLQNIFDTECQDDFEVFNLGVSGYDIQYSAERLKVRGLKYDPDLVILLVIEDDLHRISEFISVEAENFKKELESTEEGRELLKNNPYIAWTKAKFAAEETLGEEKLLDLQKSYLEKLWRIYNKNLAIVTLPGKWKKKHLDMLQDFKNSRKGSVIMEQLTNFEGGEITFPDGHPNAAGYEKIAQGIFNMMINNKIIKC
jgi:lysophospholipase L1-like esterase